MEMVLKEMNLEPESLRHILNRILSKRVVSNPHYSLRAFARSLKIDAGQLSRFLNKKRTLSRKSQKAILERLPLTEPDLSKLIEEIGPLSQFNKVDLDQFSTISEWYHFAILELTRVRGFQSKATWIAKSLNITQTEAKLAIERLLRLGYLQKSKNGELSDASGSVATFHYSGTNTALMSQQKQILENAKRAIEEVDYEERDQSTLTIAVPKSCVQEAKKRIAKFRSEMDTWMESLDEDREEVYQLSVSFFPVSRVVEKKGASHEKTNH